MEAMRHETDTHTRATYEQAQAFIAQQNEVMSALLIGAREDRIAWHQVRSMEMVT